ncbi:unnamed protein product [Choristocarpus tenellus]
MVISPSPTEEYTMDALQALVDEIVNTCPAFIVSSTGEQRREWWVDGVRGKLRRVSELHVDSNISARLSESAGLAYSAIHALASLCLFLVDPTPANKAAVPLAATERLIELVFICLANLLEDPTCRNLFSRALFVLHAERQDRAQERQLSPRPLTFQDALLCRILPGYAKGDEGRAHVEDDSCYTSSSANVACTTLSIDHAAARLMCHMMRHSPLSFPASTYAALASHLTGQLLGTGAASSASSVGSSTLSASLSQLRLDEGGDDGADIVLIVDMFAACCRGSPHFRQYVKGLRRKRDLYRRLLGLLSPNNSADLVVRSLSALTRLLAGDPLEGKIFVRNNVEQAASLVFSRLLDLSGQSDSGMQRRCAEVASDFSRSAIFMPILCETGQVHQFLKGAVTTLIAVAGNLLPPSPVLAEVGSMAPRVDPRTNKASYCSLVTAPPEPLLISLGSLCIHHSPARSDFIQEVLGRHEGSYTSSERGKVGSGVLGEDTGRDTHCLDAIFLLSLVHPHRPTVAAASALLQCLLVGGGALGAMSGPSPSMTAASGVGVIPTTYLVSAHFCRRAGGRRDENGECVGEVGQSDGGGSVFFEGLGRENPIQEELLDTLEVMVAGRGGEWGLEGWGDDDGSGVEEDERDVEEGEYSSSGYEEDGGYIKSCNSSARSNSQNRDKGRNDFGDSKSVGRGGNGKETLYGRLPEGGVMGILVRQLCEVGERIAIGPRGLEGGGGDDRMDTLHLGRGQQRRSKTAAVPTVLEPGGDQFPPCFRTPLHVECLSVESETELMSLLCLMSCMVRGLVCLPMLGT